MAGTIWFVRFLFACLFFSAGMAIPCSALTERNLLRFKENIIVDGELAEWDDHPAQTFGADEIYEQYLSAIIRSA